MKCFGCGCLKRDPACPYQYCNCHLPFLKRVWLKFWIRWWIDRMWHPAVRSILRRNLSVEISGLSPCWVSIHRNLYGTRLTVFCKSHHVECDPSSVGFTCPVGFEERLEAERAKKLTAGIGKPGG